MESIDTWPFRIAVPNDVGCVIRGRVSGPCGFAASRIKRHHVVLIHGFKGFMDWGFFPDMARRIAERDRIAVAFNMSGSGIGEDLETFSDPDAFARNTCSRELRDLALVREWIHAGGAPGVDSERATLIGHSRGGAIALLHAAVHAEIRAVVTWAAIATVDRFDAPTKAAWRQRGSILIRNARTGEDQRIDAALLDDIETNHERLDVIAACRRLKVPTLLIHGAADQAVPPQEMELLASNIPREYRHTLLVPGAGHTFGVTHPMPTQVATGIDSAWEVVASSTLAMIERQD